MTKTQTLQVYSDRELALWEALATIAEELQPQAFNVTGDSICVWYDMVTQATDVVGYNLYQLPTADAADCEELRGSKRSICTYLLQYLAICYHTVQADCETGDNSTLGKLQMLHKMVVNRIAEFDCIAAAKGEYGHDTEEGEQGNER